MSNAELTNVDVVLYSLYVLGGAKKKIFTEDIAKKSFELASSRFSWRRYSQYPDIEPARKSLMEARNQKKLITGRAGEVKGLKPSDGWIFSPEGILWLEKNLKRISFTLGRVEKTVRRTESSKRIAELETTTAYSRFIKDGSCVNIKPYEFTDFLNISLDTPPSVFRKRIDAIRALAAYEKKKKLLIFVAQCEEKFSSFLN